MGTWIEIVSQTGIFSVRIGRALMGTWIEIEEFVLLGKVYRSRALMGTWIEIRRVSRFAREREVVPSWARGLK